MSNKLQSVTIDREQICPIDKSILPKDALSKGYSDIVIQDIKIITEISVGGGISNVKNS